MNSIISDYTEKNNPDKDFMEAFYSNNGEFIFQDQLVDTKFNALGT